MLTFFNLTFGINFSEIFIKILMFSLFQHASCKIAATLFKPAAVNSLWPSDVVYHRCGSTLAQVLVYCLVATWTDADLASNVFCGIHFSVVPWNFSSLDQYKAPNLHPQKWRWAPFPPQIQKSAPTPSNVLPSFEGQDKLSSERTGPR